MVGFIRKGWDVVVAVVGGDAAAGYIDGVYIEGKRKNKRTVLVRHRGQPADVVQAVLEDLAQSQSEREPVEVPLHGYRSGEIPTYYANSDDLELLDPPPPKPEGA